MESVLQAIYVVMAGYGWWQWRFQKSAAEESPGGAKYSLRWHLLQWALADTSGWRTACLYAGVY